MHAQTTTHGTLLARIADPSDSSAWAEFCAKYEDMIRAFAMRQGATRAQADDVVQDVLLSLTKAIPGFHYNPAKGKFRSYLKTIVVHAFFRRRQRDGEMLPMPDPDWLTQAAAPEGPLDEAWEDEWRQHHLRRAMRTIEMEFSTTDVECFRAYVLEGVETAAVMDRLGLSATQVYNVKHRMLSRLREVIAAQVEDEG